MFKLIKNETIKLFSKKASWIMPIVFALAMFGMVLMVQSNNNSIIDHNKKSEVKFKGGIQAFQKQDGTISSIEYFYQSGETTKKAEMEKSKPISLDVDQSVTVLSKELAVYQANPKKFDKQLIKVTKKQLAYYKSYQNHKETPNDPMITTSSKFFSSFGDIYSIATLFSVIIASMVIASEFSGGTIKLLLTRPYSRTQILWSKYLVVIGYGLLTSLVMVASAFLCSLILPHQSLFTAVASHIGGKNGLTMALELFASNSLLALLYITIAFFFSAVVRSQALAVGVGMGVLFSGSILGQFLPKIIEKYDWLKWSLFNLLGLNNQVIDSGYTPGGNLSISEITVALLVYIILIYAITIFAFKKRDVALS